MRKLVARSLAVAMAAVLISGCSSTGGQKSFSWSSLNPMNYFAKSDDSDSPVPKPSDQMAPTVTMSSASDVAESGGTAPPSPYGQGSLGDAVQATATQVSSGSIGPQRGMYDPSAYGGGNLPVTSSSAQYEQYPTANAPNPTALGAGNYQAQQSGYQLPPASGYDAGSAAQYAMGGGNYDIQNQPRATTPALPPYTNPTAPYSNNTLPPMTGPQTSGYDAGIAQDPYGNTAPPSYPGLGSSNAAGASPNAYASNAPPAGGDSADLVASMPNLPPLPDQYQSNQAPYDPGNTGYNPPNVPPYNPPSSGGYVRPASATDANYAPGSVSRYPSTSTPTAGTASGAYGTAGSVY